MTIRIIRIIISHHELKVGDILKDSDLLKKLLSDGWILKRITGSHHVIEKDGKIEVIPIHGRDVPKGLLEKILKRAGLK